MFIRASDFASGQPNLMSADKCSGGRGPAINPGFARCSAMKVVAGRTRMPAFSNSFTTAPNSVVAFRSFSWARIQSAFQSGRRSYNRLGVICPAKIARLTPCFLKNFTSPPSCPTRSHSTGRPRDATEASVSPSKAATTSS